MKLVSDRLNRPVTSYSDRIENSFGPWARPVDILELQDPPIIRAEVMVPKFEIKAA